MEGKACDLVSKVDGNGLAVLDILAVHVELNAALAQVIDSAVNIVGQDSNVAIGAAARLFMISNSFLPTKMLELPGLTAMLSRLAMVSAVLAASASFSQ